MKNRPDEFGAIAGIVLAGGLSRRMGGGDKGLRLLGDKPILVHVIHKIRPQLDDLAINANGDLERFAQFGLKVIPDDSQDFSGPLAGILAGMDWARSKVPHATHLISVPSDSPFLPHDLVERLIAAASQEKRLLATVASKGQIHPVIGLWPLSLRDDLYRALRIEGSRKIDLWTQRHGVAVAEFVTDPIDPFFNINSPEDFREAETLLVSKN